MSLALLKSPNFIHGAEKLGVVSDAWSQNPINTVVVQAENNLQVLISPEEAPEPTWAACFSALSTTKKEVFPHTQMEFPIFLLVPVVPCVVAGHH